MLKVNVVFVLAKIIYVLANVVFAKLAIGWVGGWGWFWLNIRNGSVEPFNKWLQLKQHLQSDKDSRGINIGTTTIVFNEDSSKVYGLPVQCSNSGILFTLEIFLTNFILSTVFRVSIYLYYVRGITLLLMSPLYFIIMIIVTFLYTNGEILLGLEWMDCKHPSTWIFP